MRLLRGRVLGKLARNRNGCAAWLVSYCHVTEIDVMFS